MISNYTASGEQLGRRLNLGHRTGVYVIRNTTNDKIYIGSASRGFFRRWGSHVYHLKNKTHRNPHIQSAWLMYGSEAFEFSVIEDCEPDECMLCEQKWIDFFKPEYNLNPYSTSSRGRIVTKETRLKISEANKGRRQSIESMEKRAASNRGKKRSPEHCARMSRLMKGTTVSQETRDKIAASLKGRPPPPQAAIASRLKNTGRIQSDETRMKISIKNSGRIVTDEQRRKISATKTGYKASLETRAKMSIGITKSWIKRRADFLIGHPQ